jgi:hypothetical protein
MEEGTAEVKNPAVEEEVLENQEGLDNLTPRVMEEQYPSSYLLNEDDIIRDKMVFSFM